MSATVTACPRGCEAPNWQQGTVQWCCFEVTTPHTDWTTVRERAATANASPAAAALEDVQVHVVQTHEDVAPALAALYASMRDPIIGIDTEWRPDSRAYENDVAMVQLASSSVVVLLRTCHLQGLPQEVVDFCRDDDIVGVGFSWSNDETKMVDSFGIGCQLFSHFIDIQTQAELMGYPGYSLGTLSARLLGFSPPNAKQVTMSDWEANYLSPQQMRYAALDALVTSDLFRGLRMLHAEREDCRGCYLPLGAWPGELDLFCKHPECARRRSFATPSGLLNHILEKGHPSSIARCDECGRTLRRKDVIGQQPHAPQRSDGAVGHASHDLHAAAWDGAFGAGQSNFAAQPHAGHDVYGQPPVGRRRQRRGGQSQRGSRPYYD